MARETAQEYKVLLNKAHDGTAELTSEPFYPSPTFTRVGLLVDATEAGTYAIDVYNPARSTWVQVVAGVVTAARSSSPEVGTWTVYDYAVPIRVRWTPGATTGDVTITAFAFGGGRPT